MKKERVSRDFNESNMPHNRIEVFKDIMLNRSNTLFSVGLLLLVFAIPLIIAVIFSSQAIGSFNEYTEENYQQLLLTLNTNNLLVMIGIMILSIGLAGSYKIIRMLIWQEGIFFMHDFFKGIKENIKNFLLTGFFIGLLNLVTQYLYFNVSVSEYAIMACIIVIAFFMPSVLFILGQSIIYKLPYGQLFKNAILLAWRNFYTSVPVLILNAAIVIIPNFLQNLGYILYILLTPIFIAPLLIMFNMLYTDTLFDKYINKTNFKEIYDKGIYRNGKSRN